MARATVQLLGIPTVLYAVLLLRSYTVRIVYTAAAGCCCCIAVAIRQFAAQHGTRAEPTPAAWPTGSLARCLSQVGSTIATTGISTGRGEGGPGAPWLSALRGQHHIAPAATLWARLLLSVIDASLLRSYQDRLPRIVSRSFPRSTIKCYHIRTTTVAQHKAACAPPAGRDSRPHTATPSPPPTPRIAWPPTTGWSGAAAATPPTASGRRARPARTSLSSTRP